MKSKQFGFWTDEKKKELLAMVPDNATKPMMLKASRYFGRSWYDIYHIAQLIRNQVNSELERYIENGVQVTVYKMGSAQGITTLGYIKSSESIL